MNWPAVLLAAICMATLGCDEDPARSVKIVARPVQKAAIVAEKVTARPPQKKDKSWHLEFCPPLEDAPGPGNLVVSGPCALRQREAVTCEPSSDDFIIGIARKARHGATLVVYLNVEHYQGPGSYEGSQLFVEVQSDTVIYRWSSDQVNATVGTGETFVTLPVTRLEAEPMLIDCSRLIGPGTNYQYQCEGRSNEKMAIDNTVELVSGTLQCAGQPKQ